MAILNSDEKPLIVETLARVFGAEWSALSSSDQALIVRDCCEDGGVDNYREYRANIGAGNLQAYANTMRVRFGREARQPQIQSDADGID